MQWTHVWNAANGWGIVSCLVLAGLSSLSPRARGDGPPPDPHSFSQPAQVRVKHLELSLDVDFATRVLTGEAVWSIERAPDAADAPLILDTQALTILKVETAAGAGPWVEGAIDLGESVPVLGAPLRIRLAPDTTRVRVRYQTAPDASALQWVASAGTSGKVFPFLFTQSQAIHARSWIPCQDSPGVRTTYHATIRVRTPSPDPGHRFQPVMAAETESKTVADGTVVATFAMREPIPSYLIALAVGELEFRPLGDRAGVWAEPSVVEKAAWEFADTEKMIAAAEQAFGRYRWERYDILVLPPSFPYGGMENPRLTFATPTVLAGDRSQVALVAHELAHSWSGNLVTNATWSDFWLNEGFTVYLERRILEKVYGASRAQMEEVLGAGELTRELAELPPRDQILHIDLKGRDPEDGVTRIPYEKGALFLEALARTVGREKVRAFLEGYFDHFAFQSITTAQFVEYLRAQLWPGQADPVDLGAWIEEPGLPPSPPQFVSDRFAAVAARAAQWAEKGLLPPTDETKGWTTPEWLHFLRALPGDLTVDQLAALDRAFAFTNTGNAEIACDWFQRTIRAGYAPADAAIEAFLGNVGRRKFIVPIYKALAATPAGLTRARAIFERVKSGYHPIAVSSIDKLLEG